MIHWNIEIHNAKKDKPTKSGEYVAIIYHEFPQMIPTIMSLPYSTRHGEFNAYDYQEEPVKKMDVDYWFEIPDVNNTVFPSQGDTKGA